MNKIRQDAKLESTLRWMQVKPKKIEEALHSPVFIYEHRGIKEDEVRYLVEDLKIFQTSEGMVSMVPNWSPYPCFRLVLREGVYIQAWHEGGLFWDMVRYMPTDYLLEDNPYLTERERRNMQEIREIRARVGPSMPEDTWLHARVLAKVNPQVVIPPFHILGDHDKSLGLEVAVRASIGHKWSEFVSELTYQELQEEVNGMFAKIGSLIANVALPGSAVIRVEPPLMGNEHKSVRWRLSRTHYVVLTHQHAQRLQKEKRGPTANEIVRASHWRRGHFRRLMSARFTTKTRGKLIPVREAWVGPKSWEGSDKKIYKVEEIQGPSGQS
jgi:hypothetical protein